MRLAPLLGIAALTLAATSCHDVAAPETGDVAGPAFTVGQQTGPNNQCYGAITAGIASTWPWAHDDQTEFPPPPGSLALWVATFGPGLGVTSVRDLQILFCG
jgi:hypothetical protein